MTNGPEQRHIQQDSASGEKSARVPFWRGGGEALSVNVFRCCLTRLEESGIDNVSDAVLLADGSGATNPTV
jgi:hypothetical protein